MVAAPQLELLDLHRQFVLQLPLLVKELGSIPVIESQVILGQWPAELGLQPVNISLVAESIRLYLADTSSSQQEHPLRPKHEISEIPHPGHEEEDSRENRKTVPVPDQVERVECVVDICDRT